MKRCPIVSRCRSSNFKVTREKNRVLTRIERCQTVSPVWIYGWLLNDAQSLKWHRTGALLFQCHPSNFKVTATEKSNIGSDLSVSEWHLQFEFMDGYGIIHIASRSIRGCLLFFDVICQNLKSHGPKIRFGSHIWGTRHQPNYPQ